MARGLNLVFVGLSITSSWGNGHATTYRGLVQSLMRRGHDVLFLEYDAPWYAQNRDMPSPSFCRTELYSNLADLQLRFTDAVASADAVVVGSYVKDGVDTGAWVQRTAGGVVAFYDIDTPVTLAKLERGDFEYISPDTLPGYDLYLSFSGGATLEILMQRYGAQRPRMLGCSFDPELYYPDPQSVKWDLGYLGTYSEDRQPGVKSLLLEPALQWPAGQFVVAGPQYPESISWPVNVERINHLPPDQHRVFYNSQRYTLNITRADMKKLGHSPSVRLFEAAACGIPIISDYWTGLEEIFTPDREILLADSADDVLRILSSISDAERRDIGNRARERVMACHTSDHRAQELEQYLEEVRPSQPQQREQAYAAEG